jgi:hypothetical protein
VGQVKYAIDIVLDDVIGSGGIIYLPVFMKIGTDVQVILSVCVRNMRGCKRDL